MQTADERNGYLSIEDMLKLDQANNHKKEE